MQLVHDGVTYTPLQSSQSDWLFLLGSNGTNVIKVNGQWLCTIVVEDVVLPDGLPTSIRLGQSSEPQAVSGDGYQVNIVRLTSADCINYPYVVNDEHPYYQLRITGIAGREEDIVGFNCELVNFSSSDTVLRLSFLVVDVSSPAYITYQGYIVAVFNYSV